LMMLGSFPDTKKFGRKFFRSAEAPRRQTMNGDCRNPIAVQFS
jgi:hypothetical protein